jgi:murein DD-endopeptidase MepM/ murein hydrolase activator NlpD
MIAILSTAGILIAAVVGFGTGDSMSDVNSILKQVAGKYNLDWRALASVANAESGLNPSNVGDNGTSFGLFQLHQGGALGNMPTSRARRYLDARTNAEFAARQMSGMGLGGLRGRSAVDAMVRRFERPANPGAEVTRAMGFYGGLGGGGATTPASSSAPKAPKAVAFGGATLGGNGSLPVGVVGDLQSMINANAKIAGVAPSTVPASYQPKSTLSQRTAFATKSYLGRGPISGKWSLIGTPHSGTHTLGNWESDNAVDMGVKRGTPLYAVTSGTIGSQFGALNSSDPRMLGLRLHLVGGGNEYYYAHLSRFAPGIKPGATVRQGQLIGYSGTANGVDHLHIGVKNGNPVTLFGK